jgi:membrane-bound ClpP family serine protease
MKTNCSARLALSVPKNIAKLKRPHIKKYAPMAVPVGVFIPAKIVVLIFYAGVKAQFRRVKTGKEALIGARGLATSDLKPKGEVRVMGEFWEATAKDTPIAAGQAVEVVSMAGVYLAVKPAEQKP